MHPKYQLPKYLCVIFFPFRPVLYYFAQFTLRLNTLAKGISRSERGNFLHLNEEPGGEVKSMKGYFKQKAFFKKKFRHGKWKCELHQKLEAWLLLILFLNTGSQHWQEKNLHWKQTFEQFRKTNSVFHIWFIHLDFPCK